MTVQTPPARPRAMAATADAWTADLVDQLARGTWTPWAMWLHTAHELVPRRRRRASTPVEPIDQWHAIRDIVLDCLDALGLEATVTVTSSSIPVELGEHFADDAGLVHVHRRADPWAWTPPIDSWVLAGSDTWSRYCRAILERHSLLPAQHRLPTDLRGFAGQWAMRDTERAPLLDGHGADTGHMVDHEPGNLWPTVADHLRAWVTPAGEPVLSIEPYPHASAEQVADDVRHAIALRGLPLRVEGPLPPAWTDSSVLALVRHDHARPPAPAVHDPATVTAVWRHGALASLWADGQRLQAVR